MAEAAAPVRCASRLNDAAQQEAKGRDIKFGFQLAEVLTFDASHALALLNCELLSGTLSEPIILWERPFQGHSHEACALRYAYSAAEAPAALQPAQSLQLRVVG